MDILDRTYAVTRRNYRVVRLFFAQADSTADLVLAFHQVISGWLDGVELVLL